MKKNYEKQSSYTLAFGMIGDAIRHNYPLEAIAIEESIIADRLWSTLNVGKTPKTEWKAPRTMGDALKEWRPEDYKIKASRRNDNRNLFDDDMNSLYPALNDWWIERCRLLHGLVKSFQGSAPEIPPEDFGRRAGVAAVEGLRLANLVKNWVQKQVRKSKRAMIAVVAIFLCALNALAEITISPDSRNFEAKGGGAMISTLGSGAWTATSDSAWLQVVSASGNAGNGCAYLVSKNSNADTRTGHITIAGQVFTVTQDGCPVELTPSSANINKLGGEGVITASMDAGVQWTADVSDSWITISPASGSGASEVSFSVSAYNAVGSRTGTIRIGSAVFTITQTGIDVTLTPAATNVTKDVCIVPLQVVAMGSTAWTVTPNASWISVLDGGNGFGGSQVTLAVAENPSYAERTGTVSVGTAMFTVVQAGTDDLSFKILPAVASASPSGAFGNVAVYATPDATWSAESLDDWIRIASGEEGAGNGNVKYVTLSNPELTSRTGRIKFTPPVAIPDLDLYSGLTFWIQDQHNIEGNEARYSSQPLSTILNGTSSIDLSGAALPNKDDGEFSIAFSFKIGEADTLNRLLQIGSRCWAVNDENELCYCTVGGIQKLGRQVVANQWYTFVLRYYENGNNSIYFGLKGSELTGQNTTYGDMYQGMRNLSSIKFGYCNYPSSGYLQSGQFANIRFWTRALTDRECELIEDMDGCVFESEPATLIASANYEFFPLNGNMFRFNEESGLPNMPSSDCATGWNIGPGRDHVPGHGLLSAGEGRAVVADIGSYFESGYIANDGCEFSGTSHSRFGYTSLDWCVPCPIKMTCSSNATYSVWIKVDTLPSSDVKIFERLLTSTSLNSPYDLRMGNFTNKRPDWAYAPATENFRFNLLLTSSGKLKWTETRGSIQYEENVSMKPQSSADRPNVVAGTTVSQVFSGSDVSTNEWHMVTITARGKGAVTAYLDGVEVGNYASGIQSFAWIPPVDGRVWTASGGLGLKGGINNMTASFSIGGWQGSLDEFTLYQRILTAKEIRGLYEAKPPFAYVYHTVNQGVQDASISPAQTNIVQAGGTITVALTVPNKINWTAASNKSWMSIVGDTSGTGPANISVHVNPNTSCVSRTGTCTIGTKTFTVTQAGLNCQVEVDNDLFDVESSMGTIEVSPEGNGSWTVSTDVDWIYLSTTAGTGSEDIYFFVDYMDDYNGSRTGTITIGGKKITITQRGYDLSVEPMVCEVGGNSGAGEFGVAADADAIWEAIADVPWITIIQGSEGVGKGTVRYSFTDNTTGQTRVGHIKIAGEEYTLTQTCKLDLNTTVVGHGTVSGGGKYAQGTVVTLTASPASGYEFSHWSGDMVGNETTQDLLMDYVKNVTATFIPEAAAQSLAEKKAAQGGYYTRDQIHNLELGNLVLDVDSTTGKARIGVQLQETSDLSNPNWQPVNVTSGDLDIGSDGTVGIKANATGNAKFFRVVTPSK